MIHRYRKANPSHGGLGRAVLRLATVAGLVALSGLASPAQTARTVRIVVPLPPGGAGDIVARQLAEQVGRAHGVSVVIENHPGAGTIIGTELVAKAAPDGNTLLLNAPYLLISPQLRKVNFDPLASFAPVCHLVSSPGVIVVNSTSPYRTLADLVAAARARPGELTLASVGPGTAQHIGFEMLRRAARIDLTYVPYAGGAPAINALLGGHVTSVFAEYAPLAAHLRSGALRALATTGAARAAPLPDVPTVAESGLRDYEVDLWWGLFAPARTSSEIQTELARWFTEAMREPAVAAKLSALGFSAAGTCGNQFGSLLRRQFDSYGRIIREANIRAD